MSTAADGPLPGPLTGAVRLLRAGVLGGATLLLATGAHLLGGGELPGPATLALTTFLVGLLAVTVTARRLRLPVLLPLLGLEQGLLHVVLDATTSATTCSPAAGHVVHAAGTALACATGQPMAMTAPAGWSMWLAHLLATAVTAWVLTRGEAALWALAARAVGAATAAPGARPSRRRPQPVPVRPVALPAVRQERAAARAPPREPCPA